MVKIALNVTRHNNYAFFCPVSRLHLTMSNPVGFIDVVTPAVLNGLKFGTLIDVNNMIDVTTGTIKTSNPVQQSHEDIKESAQEDSLLQQEEKPKKRTGKKTAAEEAENNK